MSRILFITTSFENGAIPNILLDLAPIWRSHGWDCHFLALEPLPEDQASVQRCRSLGFPLESLNVGPRSVVRALLRLRRKIRELGPDLLSTHLGRADIYTPWVKGPIPMVTTHHNVRQNHGRATNWGYRISDRRVIHRTGVSQACNDSFLHDGFLSTPHSVIYNPIHPTRMVLQRSREELLAVWGWSEPIRLLVSVARLTAAKGHADLIEAVRRLRDRGYHDLRLVIAGQGPLRSDLEAQIQDAGLGSSVRLLGHWDGVADLYRAADALVFPSHWEGFGLVVLEAWLQGCPVACSDLPPLREFVEDGKNGVLFPAGDPGAVAKGIERILEDPIRSRQWSEQGREAVLSYFSPQTIALQYEEVFRRALATSLQP